MRPAPSSAAPAATAMRCLASVSGRRAVFMSSRCQEVARELVADEKKTASHHERVGGERMSQEPVARPPVGQGNQNAGEREALADFDADVEADDVRHQSIRRQRKLLKLRRQAEPVEQAEDEHRHPCIRLHAEETPEAVHVLEGLVDHGEANHRVDQERVRVDAPQHACQQRNTVADREQADVLHDILEPVEKEDDANQKQQMVVAGDHVFRAQVHERTDRGSLQALQENRILARYAVRVERRRRDDDQQGSESRRAPPMTSSHCRQYLSWQLSHDMLMVSPASRMPWALFASAAFRAVFAASISARDIFSQSPRSTARSPMTSRLPDSTSAAALLATFAHSSSVRG